MRPCVEPGGFLGDQPKPNEDVPPNERCHLQIKDRVPIAHCRCEWMLSTLLLIPSAPPLLFLALKSSGTPSLSTTPRSRTPDFFLFSNSISLCFRGRGRTEATTITVHLTTRTRGQGTGLQRTDRPTNDTVRPGLTLMCNIDDHYTRDMKTWHETQRQRLLTDEIYELKCLCPRVVPMDDTMPWSSFGPYRAVAVPLRGWFTWAQWWCDVRSLVHLFKLSPSLKHRSY